jgi:hypothetical protein
VSTINLNTKTTSSKRTPEVNHPTNPPADNTTKNTDHVAKTRLQETTAPREPTNQHQITSKTSSKTLEIAQPLLNASLESKEVSLDKDQVSTLTNLLTTTHAIPGKNGAPEIPLNLLQFLINLYQGIPHITISLIGSAAGYVIDPQSGKYNDIDVLIQIDEEITAQASSTKEFITSTIKENAREHFTRVLNHVEFGIAAQSKNPISRESLTHKELSERKKAFAALTATGDNYLSTKIVVNTPIESDFSTSGNRCSIIGFGQLEIKTTVNVSIKEKQADTIFIRGLKTPSAFDRDDLRIPLSLKFLEALNSHSELPLLQAISIDVPVEKALCELKSKELNTSHCDASKYIKGLKHTTRIGGFYPNEETRKSICALFWKTSTAAKDVDKYCEQLEKNPLQAICFLLNLLSDGAHLGMPPAAIEAAHQRSYALLFKLFSDMEKKIPEELLLKWCHLVFVLSSTPAPHTLQRLLLNSDKQDHYLITPHDHLALLLDFVNALQKHPSISLKDLPTLDEKFEKMEDLLLKVKPLLKSDQLIIFNHFLLLNYPSLLEKTEILHFDMLLLLLNALSNPSCAEKHCELVQTTSVFFEKKGLNIPNFFKHLDTLTVAEQPTSSSLVLLCIQHLASCDPKQAHAFWKYAQKQGIFANSTGDEIRAFTCIQEQKLKPKQDISKNELDATFKTIVDIINQTPQGVEVPNELASTILLLIQKLNPGNCTQEKINKLLDLYEKITQKTIFPIELRQEIGRKILDLVFQLDKNNKTNVNNKQKKQQELISSIKKLLHPPSQETMDTVVCYLLAKADHLTALQEFVNIPLFVPTLIEQWGKNLNKIAPKQILSMLSTWKHSPSTSTEESLKTHTSFVHSCIKSKQPDLLCEAERILYTELKSMPAPDRAGLFSTLIYTHPKSSDSISCFKKAVEQKIFTEDAGLFLIDTYIHLIDNIKIKKENTKEETIFVEWILSNDLLITAISKHPALEGNKLILDLVHLYMKANIISFTAAESILKLFKQVYVNRKNHADNSLDQLIRECTSMLCRQAVCSKQLRDDQKILLVDIIMADTIIFKESNNSEQIKKDLIGPVLLDVSCNLFAEIKSNYKNQNKIKKTLTLLEALRKYKKDDMTEESYYLFSCYLMQSLFYLGRLAEAQTYLQKIENSYYHILLINKAIDALVNIESDNLLCTDKTKIITEECGNWARKTPLFTQETFIKYLSNLMMLLKHSSQINSEETAEQLNHCLILLAVNTKKQFIDKSKPDIAITSQMITSYEITICTLFSHRQLCKLGPDLLDYGIKSTLFREKQWIKDLQATPNYRANKNFLLNSMQRKK